MNETGSRGRGSGFTLVEIAVVLGCFLLIMIPAMRIYRHGTQGSLKGIRKIDTMLEARRVIDQVRADLKNSCWVWDDSQNSFYTLRHILSLAGLAPAWEMTFLGFPAQGDISLVLSPGEPDLADPAKTACYRRVSRIQYRLTPVVPPPGGVPLMKLVRTETFNPKHPLWEKHPEGLSHELSAKVLFFAIEPYLVDDGHGHQQEFFWISLRLAEIQSPGSPAPQAGAGQPIAPRDPVMTDFFDTVSPTFLESYRRLGSGELVRGSTYQRNTFADPIDPADQR